MADKGIRSFQGSVVEFKQGILPFLIEFLQLPLSELLLFDVHGLFKADMEFGLSSWLIVPDNFRNGLGNLLLFQPGNGVFQEFLLVADRFDHISQQNLRIGLLFHLVLMFLSPETINKSLFLLLAADARD